MNTERLIFIRESLDLSQRELAEILNVGKSTYARWETGEKIIPLEHLIDLCNYAKITIDYALAFTNTKDKLEKQISNDQLEIGANLRNIRKLNNYTELQVAELLNTEQSVVSDYETGKTLIQTAFLYDLCNKFNIKPSEIIK